MKRTTILFFFAFLCFTLYAAPLGDDLIGTWVADVEYNNSVDTYQIVLSDKGCCTVKISNDNAEQETSGNWSYDGTMFKLNATFRNAKISYQKNIKWTSVVSFGVDNNSFNVLAKPASNAQTVRITFFRDDGSFSGKSLGEVFNEEAIPQMFANFAKDIPLRSRLAIVGADSPNADEVAFYVNELTSEFVKSKDYTIVDRANIDAVHKEQYFQASGYVNDAAFVSIGKFLGATVVVTVSISGTGSQKRMVIKAIDVLTSEIVSMVTVAL